tara:strand:- start:140 stop:658 length:519 start_codon:yes stop_codon:yes gene_type:complete
MGKMASKAAPNVLSTMGKGFDAGNEFIYGENPAINPNYARLAGLIGPGTGTALSAGMEAMNQPFSHHFTGGKSITDWLGNLIPGIENLFSGNDPKGGGRMAGTLGSKGLAGAVGTQAGRLPGLLGYTGPEQHQTMENFPNTSYDQWGNPVTVENMPLGTTGGGVKNQFAPWR